MPSRSVNGFPISKTCFIVPILLTFSCQEGHLSLLKFFYSSKASFEKTERNHGRSELHMASLGQHPECVTFLLRVVGLRDFPDSEGRLASDFAIYPAVKEAF